MSRLLTTPKPSSARSGYLLLGNTEPPPNRPQSKASPDSNQLPLFCGPFVSAAGAGEVENFAKEGFASHDLDDPGTFIEKPNRNYPNDHWSADGFVFFTGGYGWAVDKTGNTFCMGPETPRTPPQKPLSPKNIVPKLLPVGRHQLKISQAQTEIIMGQGLTLREKAQKTGLSKNTIARRLARQK